MPTRNDRLERENDDSTRLQREEEPGRTREYEDEKRERDQRDHKDS
jgi:hypothetical protein